MCSNLEFANAEDSGHLGKSVGDVVQGIVGVVEQIIDQLAHDWGDDIEGSLAQEDDGGEDLEELVDDGSSEGGDLSPDKVQTQSGNHKVPDTSDLSDLLIGGSFAGEGEDRLHLVESVPDVGGGISSVVVEVIDQLDKDRGDDVDGSSSEEKDLGHDRVEEVDSSISDGKDSLNNRANTESKNILDGSNSSVPQPGEDSLFSSWFHGEGARGEANGKKNSKHFKIVFFFGFRVLIGFYFSIIDETLFEISLTFIRNFPIAV